MANFDGIVAIANDAGFQSRCKYALVVAAMNVMAEANNTANHQERVDFARKVIADSVSIGPVALLTMTNAAIAAEANSATTPDFAIPDGDLQFAVNALFNTLAGVAS